MSNEFSQREIDLSIYIVVGNSINCCSGRVYTHIHTCLERRTGWQVNGVGTCNGRHTARITVMHTDRGKMAELM